MRCQQCHLDWRLEYCRLLAVCVCVCVCVCVQVYVMSTVSYLQVVNITVHWFYE